MKKIIIFLMMILMLTLWASETITIKEFAGALSNKENAWLIQTESETVEIYFGTETELADRSIKLAEYKNISVKCAMIEKKMTVIEFTVGKDNFKLRDAEGKLIAVVQKGYRVDAKACIGCNICPSKCPVNAITMVKGKAVINADECIDCGICETVCPVGAISH